jgi:hypothetical protein
MFSQAATSAIFLTCVDRGKAFAFAMINLIPTKQGDVTADKNSLDASVVKTVTLYKQLCIPSPLYPTLPAICIGLHL